MFLDIIPEDMTSANTPALIITAITVVLVVAIISVLLLKNKNAK